MCDVYAFGITLYELLVKRSAWHGFKPDEIKAKVLAGERPAIPDTLGPSLGSDFVYLLEILTSCWRDDPLERPTFDDLYDSMESRSSIFQSARILIPRQI